MSPLGEREKKKKYIYKIDKFRDTFSEFGTMIQICTTFKVIYKL